MWLPVLGLLFGILLGWLTNINIPAQYADYLTITVLAGLDTLLGGIRSYLRNEFDEKTFVSGFLFNLFLAGGLTFLGVQLGVDLYLAAVFAFGVRMFRNLASIRRIIMAKSPLGKNED